MSPMTIQIEQRDLLACVSLPSLSDLQTHRVCGIRLDECGLNRNYTARVCVWLEWINTEQVKACPHISCLPRSEKDFVWNGPEKVCMYEHKCVCFCVRVFLILVWNLFAPLDSEVKDSSV